MSPTSVLFASLRRGGRRFSPLLCFHHHRFLSTQLDYPLTHPIYSIWAANTSLGKTLVSAGLSISFLSSAPDRKFVYFKPVQTGFPQDSDSRFVYKKFSEFVSLHRPERSVLASNHVLRASAAASEELLDRECGSGIVSLGWHEENLVGNAGGLEASELVCKTLYAWREALSPHLVAEKEGARVGDVELLEMLESCLGNGSETWVQKGGKNVDMMCVVETAGGVASPGPSGSLQCDLYRPFRLPAILVGDGKLGGISATISAYETLKLRGYDVVAIVFEDHGLLNEAPLLSYLRDRVPVLVLPPVPQEMSNNLMEWFYQSQDIFNYLQEIMCLASRERLERLRYMTKKAREIFWWPFTQHKLVSEEQVTMIDSRCGENFAVHKVKNADSIVQQFDACASWWTQGPDASLQIELARDMGYATSRYGHVMFPENVYEPALECAEILLEGVGKGWASRAYFSDNGSTAIEIALKMALRKFLFDHKVLLENSNGNGADRYIDLKVLALRGSYHGDTLGAMEAQAPSPYTGFYQQPWYTGRGHFLDPPKVSLCRNVWTICLPKNIQPDNANVEDLSFRSRDDIFDKKRDVSSLADVYSSYISQELSENLDPRGFMSIGALIIEPVIQGAGGMEMIDPLFQRILTKECQSRKIPVIFDEVFTGFWRLGRESAAELLSCQPDIACYAKLMTGGVIPLAVTLASEAVFEAFFGDSKLKALLHGHSYSAHALGCTAAVKSMKWFKDCKSNSNLTCDGRLLKELWDENLVRQISLLPAVGRVVVLGTLCAMELQAEGSDAGYASLYAANLIQKLRDDGIYMRPLGNVIYVMCGPCTSPQVCSNILEKIYTRLKDLSEAKTEPLAQTNLV
nr:bifunctional dethiobiotin synthetase/7,8-diamino-pelargonic acid aminotransferase, mitochondrial [Ipomoea trifida]